MCMSQCAFAVGISDASRQIDETLKAFTTLCGEPSKRRGCVGGGSTLLFEVATQEYMVFFQRGTWVFVRGCGGFRQNKQHSRRTWCFEFSATGGLRGAARLHIGKWTVAMRSGADLARGRLQVVMRGW